MVANPQQPTWRKMSFDEYLDLCETDSSNRWEYIKGYAVMIAGSSFGHTRVGVNLLGILNPEFQKGPCYVCGSDMAVRVAEDTVFVPDVSITCNVADADAENRVLQHPYLVAETLSPSTQAKDRNTKLRLYQNHPTIQEILLINTHHQEVEVYQRHPDEPAAWTQHRYFPGQDVQLYILDISFPVDSLYRRSKVPIQSELTVEEMLEEDIFSPHTQS